MRIAGRFKRFGSLEIKPMGAVGGGVLHLHSGRSAVVPKRLIRDIPNQGETPSVDRVVGVTFAG